MTVERIFISPHKRGPQQERPAVLAASGRGLENDRYCGLPANQGGGTVTLVEAEEIEAFLAAHGQPNLFGSRDFSITRRNIVTRGDRLNDLVGREFTIGGARLRGMELCEPCSVIGKLLQGPDLPPAQVIKALLHRAGLRAEIVADGEIAVGAELTPLPLQSAAE